MLEEKSISIYDALNEIKTGKYVMPAFQRQYVWGMSQIEGLWDSILQGYPISSFLFWHIDDNNVSNDTYFCQFMKNVTFNSKKKPDDANYSLETIDLKSTNVAVLDGQQRLTSLYISLMGETYIRNKYEKKYSGAGVVSKIIIELNKNKIETQSDYNTKKFDIKFIDKVAKIDPTQFEIKNIIEDQAFKNKFERDESIENAIKYVPPDSKEYAKSILKTLCEKVFDEKIIRYTEIYDMKQDDAVEMFVRFNSGGSPLKKSDITMSMLEAYWSESKMKFAELFKEIKEFNGFGEDFIIRTSHMIYGNVIKSNLSKCIANSIRVNWLEFKQSFKNTVKILKSLKIDTQRFKSSWNILIPIIFCVYYNTNYKQYIAGIKAYICRAIFFSYFRSGTTNKLQTLKNAIITYNYEISVEMLDQINELSVKDSKIEDILNCEKGRLTGEVLYYLSLGWIAPNEIYEQDHMHPESRFSQSQPYGVLAPIWAEWRKLYNKLPNLELLTPEENKSKGNMSFEDFYKYYKKQCNNYKNEAMFINDTNLGIEKFGEFYNERKLCMANKIRTLLTTKIVEIVDVLEDNCENKMNSINDIEDIKTVVESFDDETLDRFIPYEYKKLNGEKIQDYVKRIIPKLLKDGVIDSFEKLLMQDLEYSKKTFDLQYPFWVNSISKVYDSNGQSRYYTKPVEFNEFYICSQWWVSKENIYEKKIKKWIVYLFLKNKDV